MSAEEKQCTARSMRSSGSSGTQISGKGGHHMTKLEIIDEMPPAFLDVEDIMKKKRSKRSMEEKRVLKEFVESVKFFRDAIRSGSL